CRYRQNRPRPRNRRGSFGQRLGKIDRLLRGCGKRVWVACPRQAVDIPPKRSTDRQARIVVLRHRGAEDHVSVAGYFALRFQMLSVRPLPSLVVKSVGRSWPGEAKQNLTVSPVSS